MKFIFYFLFFIFLSCVETSLDLRTTITLTGKIDLNLVKNYYGDENANVVIYALDTEGNIEETEQDQTGNFILELDIEKYYSIILLKKNDTGINKYVGIFKTNSNNSEVNLIKFPDKRNLDLGELSIDFDNHKISSGTFNLQFITLDSDINYILGNFGSFDESFRENEYNLASLAGKIQSEFITTENANNVFNLTDANGFKHSGNIFTKDENFIVNVSYNTSDLITNCTYESVIILIGKKLIEESKYLIGTKFLYKNFYGDGCTDIAKTDLIENDSKYGELSGFYTFILQSIISVDIQGVISKNAALDISIPSYVTSAIDESSDIDIYKISAQANEEISTYIVSDTTSQFDSEISFFTEAGELLGYNDDFQESKDSKLSITIPSDGSYLIVVTDKNNQGGSSYGYTLYILKIK